MESVLLVWGISKTKDPELYSSHTFSVSSRNSAGGDPPPVGLQAEPPGGPPEEAGRHRPGLQVPPPATPQRRERHSQPGQGERRDKP